MSRIEHNDGCLCPFCVSQTATEIRRHDAITTGRWPNEKLYKELVAERENLFGWFKTPLPAAPPSCESIELAKRVLANQRARDKEKSEQWARLHVEMWQKRHVALRDSMYGQQVKIGAKFGNFPAR